MILCSDPRRRHEASREHIGAVQEWTGEKSIAADDWKVCRGVNIGLGAGLATGLGVKRGFVKAWWLAGCLGVKGSFTDDILVATWI